MSQADVFIKQNHKAHFLRRLTREAGFTIIEVMAAMTMISVSSVGLLWSVNAVKNNSSRVQLVNTVTTLESAVAGAIMEKSNYSNDDKIAMRNGLVPQIGLTIAPQVEGGKAGTSSVLRSGTVVNYSPTFEPCTTYGTADCAVRIRVELRRMGSATTRTSFAFAYRIETKDPAVSFNYIGGGSSGDFAGAFSNEEFKLVVPYDFYLESPLVACKTGEDIALTGVDAATGKAICIKQPQAADLCPDGTMPKSLKFIEDADGNRKIIMSCGEKAKDASCPTNYFLQQIDTTTLDGDYTGPKKGTCVYAGSTSTSSTTVSTGKHISGRACPPGYRSRSTCTINQNSIKSKPGSCPWCWGSAQDCGSSYVAEAPAGSGNFTRTTKYFCSDTSAKAMPSNVGQAVLRQNSEGGLQDGYVDCRIQIPQQDCGATWDAEVDLTVSCEMYKGGNPAETVNVQ